MSEYGMTKEEYKDFTEVAKSMYVQEVDAVMDFNTYRDLLEEMEAYLQQAEEALPDIDKYIELTNKASDIADKLGWLGKD